MKKSHGIIQHNVHTKFAQFLILIYNFHNRSIQTSLVNCWTQLANHLLNTIRLNNIVKNLKYEVICKLKYCKSFFHDLMKITSHT